MKHLKYFFLTFALALCMVAMSGFASHGNYASAVGNDSVDVFTSIDVDYSLGYSVTENRTSNDFTLTLGSLSITRDFHFNYVITRTSNGFVFSIRNDLLYVASGVTPITYSPYFNGINVISSNGSADSFTIVPDYAYTSTSMSNAFWFTDVSSSTSGTVSSLAVSYAPCVNTNTGVVDSRVPANLLDPNYSLGTKFMLIHTINYTTGGLRVIFLVDNFFPTNDTYYFDGTMQDSQYYSNGYNDGYNNGYIRGNDEGLTNGYNDGYNAGRLYGYNEGIIASNDYSFIGLLGATLDAPISAVRSMFNFEILGVNLTAFMFGLFTIALILVIIKKVRGS